MDWQIDHVVVAGRDLDSLQRSFAEAGLDAPYGGEHANGVTHNCILGFPDGSYFELIGKLGDGEPPWWTRQIEGDAGPTAWALVVDDIEAAAAELADRGVTVEEPNRHGRERPDGTPIEWEMAIVGEELGTSLPFLIQDRTPRTDRVYPTGEPADIGVEGVSELVLAVSDLEASVDRFRAFFDAAGPTVSERTFFGAEAARFDDAPVTLLRARDDETLSERVDSYGDCLTALFFETTNDADLATTSTEEWFDRSVSLLDVDVDGWYGALNP